MSKNRKKGFTIIELVIVMVVVGIIAVIGVPLVLELAESLQYSIYTRGLSADVDSAMMRMSREIRRLQNSTSVVTANSTTYRFLDIDGNTRQFALNGNNLERFDGTNTDTLLANVSAFTFTYLDQDLNTIATPQVSPNATDIRFVQVDLTVSSAGNTINSQERIRLHRLASISELFS